MQARAGLQWQRFCARLTSLSRDGVAVMDIDPRVSYKLYTEAATACKFALAGNSQVSHLYEVRVSRMAIVRAPGSWRRSKADRERGLVLPPATRLSSLRNLIGAILAETGVAEHENPHGHAEGLTDDGIERIAKNDAEKRALFRERHLGGAHPQLPMHRPAMLLSSSFISWLGPSVAPAESLPTRVAALPDAPDESTFCRFREQTSVGGAAEVEHDTVDEAILRAAAPRPVDSRVYYCLEEFAVMLAAAEAGKLSAPSAGNVPSPGGSPGVTSGSDEGHSPEEVSKLMAAMYGVVTTDAALQEAFSPDAKASPLSGCSLLVEGTDSMHRDTEDGAIVLGPAGIGMTLVPDVLVVRVECAESLRNPLRGKQLHFAPACVGHLVSSAPFAELSASGRVSESDLRQLFAFYAGGRQPFALLKHFYVPLPAPRSARDDSGPSRPGSAAAHARHEREELVKKAVSSPVVGSRLCPLSPPAQLEMLSTYLVRGLTSGAAGALNPEDDGVAAGEGESDEAQASRARLPPPVGLLEQPVLTTDTRRLALYAAYEGSGIDGTEEAKAGADADDDPSLLSNVYIFARGVGGQLLDVETGYLMGTSVDAGSTNTRSLPPPERNSRAVGILMRCQVTTMAQHRAAGGRTEERRAERRAQRAALRAKGSGAVTTEDDDSGHESSDTEPEELPHVRCKPKPYLYQYCVSTSSELGSFCQWRACMARSMRAEAQLHGEGTPGTGVGWKRAPRHLEFCESHARLKDMLEAKARAAAKAAKSKGGKASGNAVAALETSRYLPRDWDRVKKLKARDGPLAFSQLPANSWLLHELLTGKLRSTLKAFYKRVAANASEAAAKQKKLKKSPSKAAATGDGAGGADGPESPSRSGDEEEEDDMLTPEDAQRKLGTVQWENDISQQVHKIEKAVTRELQVLCEYGVYPTEELHTIRHEFEVLDGERRAILRRFEPGGSEASTTGAKRADAEAQARKDEARLELVFCERKLAILRAARRNLEADRGVASSADQPPPLPAPVALRRGGGDDGSGSGSESGSYSGSDATESGADEDLSGEDEEPAPRRDVGRPPAGGAAARRRRVESDDHGGRAGAGGAGRSKYRRTGGFSRGSGYSSGGSRGTDDSSRGGRDGASSRSSAPHRRALADSRRLDRAMKSYGAAGSTSGASRGSGGSGGGSRGSSNKLPSPYARDPAPAGAGRRKR